MCSRGGAPPDNSLPFLGSETVPGMTPSILTPTLASSQQPAVDTRHAYFSNEDLRLPVSDPPRVAQLVAEQICESGLQSPHSAGQEITPPAVGSLLLTSPCAQQFLNVMFIHATSL